MFHLAAWYESIDPAGVLSQIAAVPDQHIFTSGDDVRIPGELPNIIGQVALANDASLARAQLSSPSLRAIALLDMEPIVAAKVFGSPPEGLFHPGSPIPLEPDESLNCLIESNPAAAAIHYGLVWLSDGKLDKVDGKIYTIRATAAAALAAGQWVNSALAFSQVLPVGQYSIVGMRARGTNLLAARLVFVGGKFCPGVPAVNAVGDLDTWYTRYGGLGEFGKFDTNTPPTVDCLGDTDAAQVIELDIIKVG